MMHDSLDPRSEGQLNERKPSVSGEAAESRLADREVPLPGMSSADKAVDVINQWLDGEVNENVARHADARSVDFWKRVELDAGVMRSRKTPTHVAAQIMSAIPVREPGA